MKVTARIALAATLAPVAIGLLGACSAGAAGHDSPTSTDAAGVLAVTDAAIPQDPASTAHPAGHHDNTGAGGAVSSGNDGNAAGSSGIGTQGNTPKPAPQPPEPKFTSLQLSAATGCPSGSSITPKLSWTTKHASFVGVSVDAPGAISDYGAFDSNTTISLPAVQCAGPLGKTITHRYDVWALGGLSSTHRVLHMSTTVKALVTFPVPVPTFVAPTPSPIPTPFPIPTVPITFP